MVILDIDFMNEALLEANKAMQKDEVPIGCVIVKDGKIIGRGHNTVELDNQAFAHAEINAIREASDYIGGWRLDGCTIYVSLEPCAMCAGAIVRSRIERLVVGLRDPKRGCAGSVYNLVCEEKFNHRLEVTYDVLANESRDLLQEFFRKKRKVVE